LKKFRIDGGEWDIVTPWPITGNKKILKEIKKKEEKKKEKKRRGKKAKIVSYRSFNPN